MNEAVSKEEEFLERLLSGSENEFLLDIEISLYMAENSLRWRSPNFLFDCRAKCLVYDRWKRTGKKLHREEFGNICGCCIFVEKIGEEMVAH